LNAGDPIELRVIRDALIKNQQTALTWRMRQVLVDPEAPTEQRFRAACALASGDSVGTGDPEELWPQSAPIVARQLVAAIKINPSRFMPWLELLRPIRSFLLVSLGEVYHDRKHELDRDYASRILAEYTSDRPIELTDLLLDGDEQQFLILFPKAEQLRRDVIPILRMTVGQPPGVPGIDRERFGKRQANAAAALLKLQDLDDAWDILKHSRDPTARSYFIHHASRLAVDPRLLWNRFQREHDISIRRALLLAIGEYAPQWPPNSERPQKAHEVLECYREDDDAGIHAAAEWLLRQWNQENQVLALLDAWAKAKPHRDLLLKAIAAAPPQPAQAAIDPKYSPKARWYVNTQGQTLVVIPAQTFLMGSPATEPGRDEKTESQVPKTVRSFAIAANEVTNEQFRRFRPAHPPDEKAPRPDSPANLIKWYRAAEYCNWLSQQDGIPPNEWCYEPSPSPPNAPQSFAEGMKVRANFLHLKGYRLPTEEEWECACRSGTITSRHFGESADLLPSYAWFLTNSNESALSPIGRFKPNDFGLFDMLGNGLEWCHDRFGNNGNAAEETIYDKDPRLMRGGSFGDLAGLLRSAARSVALPDTSAYYHSFRPARTVP
jgi:formylglycine-generating enzyme required for sulfatase activity